MVLRLHPCVYISQFSKTFRNFNRSRTNYSYNDFQTYCNLVKNEPQSNIIKHIITFPNNDQIQHFKKLYECKGNLTHIIDSFDFLPEEVQSILAQTGITKPTPIQQAIIPAILNGHDVIALAQTGSGKTLAFALPGLLHCQAQESSTGPRILVLAPTRELAQQIESQYKQFGNTACFYGGVMKEQQYSAVNKKPSVIIATPGRLLDLMEHGLSLNTISQVVLDEADRMLDMGFEQDIREILSNVRGDRQTLFFSATWPNSVQTLAGSLCQQDPLLIQIGARTMSLSVNKEILQEIIPTADRKFDQLLDVLAKHQNQKVLIFCQRKKDTQTLEYKMAMKNIHAKYINGDLTQNQRDNLIRDFKSGQLQCLIATNLASRGLDVSDVDLVINYDFPDTIEDYIHRIGRTGRAGKKGKAISFIDWRYIPFRFKQEIKTVLKQSNQELPYELQ